MNEYHCSCGNPMWYDGAERAWKCDCGEKSSAPRNAPQVMYLRNELALWALGRNPLSPDAAAKYVLELDVELQMQGQ